MIKHFSEYRALIMALMLATLVGCGGCSGTNVAPQNIGEGILLANETIANAAVGVRRARDQGVITQERAEEFRDRLRDAADLTDAATTAYTAGRETDAQDYLYSATLLVDSVLDLINEGDTE